MNLLPGEINTTTYIFLPDIKLVQQYTPDFPLFSLIILSLSSSGLEYTTTEITGCGKVCKPLNKLLILWGKQQCCNLDAKV